MSGSGKLNLIWFRDEEPAKRLRVRPGWIRAFTYFLVLVVLGAGGGIFTAYEFWRRSQDMQAEKRDVEKRLNETLLKLERLQNIEKLLQTSDASEMAQLLGGLNVDTQAGKAPQAAPNAKSGGKDAPAAKNGTPERERPPGFDLADVMGKVDLGQVGVENFRAKVDAKGIHYGFDLSNLMPQALSGSGQLLAVGRDGGVIPVPTGKEDLGFSIQRFKQVSSQAALPQGVDPGNLYGFRLVLSNASGKTIFSETYPLAQAQ
ncbi:hypothetical protein [Fundidesulfovibrio terrae]|uniref:hypothetical protein n=1 Tax=Fundidesulfovibrio terrae TaxID=2922866 RepID=UPI001FAF426F|nr:hypothetical protein [Fundidesulfovibrio terrae]